MFPFPMSIFSLHTMLIAGERSNIRFNLGDVRQREDASVDRLLPSSSVGFTF